MAGTKLQVVKADGCVEGYLHTKVVGAISNALGVAGQAGESSLLVFWVQFTQM